MTVSPYSQLVNKVVNSFTWTEKFPRPKECVIFLTHGIFFSSSPRPLQVREVTARVKNDDDETVSKRVGYQITQAIEVSSTDVDSTPRLSRECAQLLEQGVALISDGVQFIYTKAGQDKIEMMG